MNLASFELIRTKADIVQTIGSRVRLKAKGGNEYLGLCPFHSEKTPSFTVNGNKGFYHCFGCGAHGDVIKFTAETQSLSYKQAAVTLAEVYNIHLHNQNDNLRYAEHLQLYQVLEVANNFFKAQLTPNVRDYLVKRDVDTQIIEKFELGFAPLGNYLTSHLQNSKIAPILINKAGLLGKSEQGQVYEVFRNRLIFPIRNANQKLIGFGGRTLDNKVQPKYLNSPETAVFKKKESLYGEHLAFGSAYKEKRIIVVEGYMDCIALHQHGFSYTVATLGTAISDAHLTKLWQAAQEIVICLDGDEAGKRAVEKVIELALPGISNSNALSFILLPESLDPEEFLRYYGEQEFQTLIEQRRPLSQTIWQKLSQGYSNRSTAEAKAQLETELQAICDKIKDKILQKNFRQFFKEKCWQLFSKQNNGQQPIRLAEKLPLSVSSLINIECNLLAICVQNPDQKDIIENLAEVKFTNEYLDSFKEFLYDHIILQHNNSTTLLNKSVARSGFQKTYQNLLVLNNIFFDRMKFKEQLSDLWKLFTSQHYLAQLHAEYKTLNNFDITKTQNYRQEIINLQQQINAITKNLNLID